MFQVRPTDTDRIFRLAVLAVIGLSLAALGVAVWVMIEFLDEQRIVNELINDLPRESLGKAYTLEGELKWQFRLSILVMLNSVVIGFAVVLLSRAYRSSQRSLRDIKALAADVLSSMDLGILTTNLRGSVTSINRRGMQMLRLSRECVGQDLNSLPMEIPLSAYRDQFATNADAFPRDFEIERQNAVRILRASCQPLKDYQGEQIGNILQLHDVTERVLVEKRLRRMERYMGLGSLALGLHHEIKNPLAALSLHVQLLEEQLDDQNSTEEIPQAFGVIKAEVNRIGKVLESFRDFASIGDLELEPIPIPRLIARQLDLIAPRAKQQGIEIHHESPAIELPTVFGDCGRLEQVLLNLLLNSIEAMPAGGQLAVSARLEADMVLIEVSDTGGGIPADLRDKVLDPYFTTKSQGTGLGLAICDKIMRQHQGSLDFRCSDSGTVFVLSLPIAQPQPPCPT